MKHIGFVILGIWLISTAVLNLTQWHFAHEKTALAILALVAGSVILLSAVKERFSDLGMLLLGIWLLLRSVMHLFQLSFPHAALVLDCLAAVSGVLLILRK